MQPIHRFALILVASCVTLVPSLSAQDRPSVEEMRAEAEKAIEAARGTIEKRVGEAVAKFAMNGTILGADEVARTRRTLVSLGAAATSTRSRIWGRPT